MRWFDISHITPPHLVMIVDIGSFVYKHFNNSIVSILTCKAQSSGTIFLVLNHITTYRDVLSVIVYAIHCVFILYIYMCVWSRD